MKREGDLAAERQKITAALSHGAEHDKFWGVRVEAATALGRLTRTEIRTALLAATKDKDARVRTSAVNSLAKSKDAELAAVYLYLLNDPSYATIRAAAMALGETKNAAAYDALVKLLDAPSWRDQLRASALTGLANLGDKRAFELASRYAAPGNQVQVRASAITLLGAIGKDDPRAFSTRFRGAKACKRHNAQFPAQQRGGRGSGHPGRPARRNCL